jgi:hypothetical protein
MGPILTVISGIGFLTSFSQEAVIAIDIIENKQNMINFETRFMQHFFCVSITILKKIIPILICLFIGTLAFSQNRYSIDINPVEERMVPIGYFIQQTAESFKSNVAFRKKKRNEKKESDKIRKHVHRIQTKEIKKRMRQSLKKAENFNKGKIPLIVKLNKLLGNG